MASDEKFMMTVYTDTGIEHRLVTDEEAAMLRIKSITISLVLAAKHNLGYPEGSRHPHAPSNENDLEKIKTLFLFGRDMDVSKWDTRGVASLNALREHLKAMVPGDKLTAGEVASMVALMEKKSMLRVLGLQKWSKAPCSNLKCPTHGKGKK
ncbi:uncharacterized protein LY89DRAFT_368314 [Mollisia scopiformis]|uniref:Uncharacterized protein n=1 Tax=Mollisia scopiformis TaxID=149040 RepID=A0A132B5D3_MOLSC|nr:uncharacterized protein LY89DRAFT_368314 [Mollisia scopiformis]KUJ07104.1 hypothetical protein LY89DRAFT_368314 [Mollisia scopiformis]